MFSAFLLGAAVLAAHLFFLQFDSEVRGHYIASVEDRWHSFEQPQGRRGSIRFRDGSVIAGNRKMARVIVEPKMIEDLDRTAFTLAKYLGGDARELREKIATYERPGLVLAEGLPIEAALALDDESLRGVFTRYHYQRYYPHGQYGAATTVGFAGKETVHRLGLEKSFDDSLTGRDGHIVFKKDASRKRLPGSIEAQEARIDGADITTTLHPAVQTICEDELRKSVDSNDPDSASIIVMDPHSGEVLGAATYPTFDPNEYVNGNIANEQNVLVHNSLEPGSTIKPLLAAYALDRGWLSEAKRYVCNRYLKVDGYTIREAEAGNLVGDSNGVTISSIIKQSSNIGMAQLAMELGQHRVMEAYEGLGFFARTGVELPAEEKGIRPYFYEQKRSKKDLRWPRVTLANTGFGQGMSVTPMQLATAYCVIANGGFLVRPTLLRDISAKAGDEAPEDEAGAEGSDTPLTEPADDSQVPADVLIGARKPGAQSLLAAYQQPGESTESYDPRPRVLSEHSCKVVSEWLLSAVEEGTGKRAKLSRFKAAGKTGTAQIAGRGGYQKGAYTASFAGFFPAEKPRYVVLVMLVNPKSGKYYGGEIAAPVFKAVGDRISFLDQIETLGAMHAD